VAGHARRPSHARQSGGPVMTRRSQVCSRANGGSCPRFARWACPPVPAVCPPLSRCRTSLPVSAHVLPKKMPALPGGSIRTPGGQLAKWALLHGVRITSFLAQVQGLSAQDRIAQVPAHVQVAPDPQARSRARSQVRAQVTPRRLHRSAPSPSPVAAMYGTQLPLAGHRIGAPSPVANGEVPCLLEIRAGKRLPLTQRVASW
jgi:hypothetical protein